MVFLILGPESATSSCSHGPRCRTANTVTEKDVRQRPSPCDASCRAPDVGLHHQSSLFNCIPETSHAPPSTDGAPNLNIKILSSDSEAQDLCLVGSASVDPWEDPKSRSANSGLYYSYGVDYGTPKAGSPFWIRPGVWVRKVVSGHESDLASSSTAPEDTASCDFRMIFTARFTPAISTFPEGPIWLN